MLLKSLNFISLAIISLWRQTWNLLVKCFVLIRKMFHISNYSNRQNGSAITPLQSNTSKEKPISLQITYLNPKFNSSAKFILVIWIILNPSPIFIHLLLLSSQLTFLNSMTLSKSIALMILIKLSFHIKPVVPNSMVNSCMIC